MIAREVDIIEILDHKTLRRRKHMAQTQHAHRTCSKLECPIADAWSRFIWKWLEHTVPKEPSVDLELFVGLNSMWFLNRLKWLH